MKRFLFTFFIFSFAFQLSSQRISKQQQEKLASALSLVSRYYVDSIQENKVIESAIVGMLESLDPHSKYLSAKTVKGFNENFSGGFVGIGVQFQIVKDTITVVRTMTGTPAEKVGVLPNDKFIQIEDTLVAGVGIQYSDITKKLRGKKGTPVNVKIKRGRQKELIDFRIIRDKIPLNSVDASYMVTDKIGYIRIDLFGAKTHQEFINALQKL
ncbi:MAG: peptidase S41, partial [Paludibacter sp.]